MDDLTAPNKNALLRWLAILLLLFTIVLVWVGAGVTTRDYGMAVYDWPSSFGQYNPPGWWENIAVRFEHGHRLLGQLVGLLTAALFAVAWFRYRGNVPEFLLVLLVIGLMIGFAWAGGRPLEASKWRWWTPLLILDAAFLAWWLAGWLLRGWHPLRVMATLASWAVVNQAIMGGVRVTQISNLWAVFHGCFAQAFFCLVVLLVMATSPSWHTRRDLIQGYRLRSYCRFSFLMVAAVFLQLIFGASMRHFHRVGLVATDFPTMNGQWIPRFENADILVHFCHRVWAFVVLAIGGFFAFRAPRILADHPRLRRLVYVLPALLVIQITLGITVILSRKGFWITNLHVATGLALLAFSFVLAVRGFRALPTYGLLAEDAVQAMRRSDETAV